MADVEDFDDADVEEIGDEEDTLVSLRERALKPKLPEPGENASDATSRRSGSVAPPPPSARSVRPPAPDTANTVPTVRPAENVPFPGSTRSSMPPPPTLRPPTAPPPPPEVQALVERAKGQPTARMPEVTLTVEEMRARYSEMAQRLAEKETALNDTIAERNSLLAEITKRDTKIHELSRVLEEARQDDRVRTLETELADRDEAVRRLELELDGKKHTIERLEQRLAALKSSPAMKSAALQEAVGSAESANGPPTARRDAADGAHEGDEARHKKRARR